MSYLKRKVNPGDWVMFRRGGEAKEPWRDEHGQPHWSYRWRIGPVRYTCSEGELLNVGNSVEFSRVKHLPPSDVPGEVEPNSSYSPPAWHVKGIFASASAAQEWSR